jgi:uncharacterized HAD superfamily protein
MEKHLEKIGQMLVDFKNGSEINYGTQISISGNVKYNVHQSLNITSNSKEFEKKTIGEVKSLGYSLNESIRQYLEDNQVKERIKIATITDREFGVYFSGFEVSYKMKHITK